MKISFRRSAITLSVASLLVTSCAQQSPVLNSAKIQSGNVSVDDLYVVNCLLPAPIKKLGQQLAYKSGRQAIKTTATDCSIRGGDYAAFGQTNFSTALQTWLPGAQAGDPEAQTYVGEIYEKGIGTQADYRTAVLWYQKAIAQDFARAKGNLGYLYERGLGVQKDLNQALTLYRQASGLEHSDLNFAVSVETALRTELDQEVRVLRTEIQRNQLESKQLSQAIKRSRQQLSTIRNKASVVREQLGGTRKQIRILMDTPYGISNDASLTRKKKALQAQAAALEENWQALQQQIKASSGNHNQLQQQLLSTEKKVTRLDQLMLTQTAEYDAIAQSLKVTKSKLANAKKTQSQLTAEFNAEKARIDKVQQSAAQVSQQNSQATTQMIEKMQSDLGLLNTKIQQENTAVGQIKADLTRLEQEKTAIQSRSDVTEQDKNRQLRSYAQQLTAKTKQLEQQQGQIARLQQEKNDLDQSQINSAQQKQTKIKSLDASLQQQQKELKQQQSLIAQYQSDKSRLQALLSQAKKPIAHQQTSVATAPNIEIIDPPLTLTRGLPSIRLRSSVRYQNIKGQVDAQNGILSFLVNDQKVKLKKSGDFNTRISLAAEKTPVRVVAVDNNGQRTAFDFMVMQPSRQSLQPSNSSKSTTETPVNGEKIDFGRYHALIIGNNSYQHLPELDTPINDANVIEQVLKSAYGFKTKVLINANRYAILSALNELRGKLTEKDNLFIYYAGHGELDEINMRGHWLPVDAEANNNANWISTVAITDILNAMKAKHIMVVADSCYSGAMTRTSLARLEPGMSEAEKRKWMMSIASKRVRTVLTSGSLTPVLDGLGGKHSVFAQSLINALKKNKGVLIGQNLYREISTKVRADAAKVGFEQSPQYAPLRHTGHEAGDFFFIPKG